MDTKGIGGRVLNYEDGEVIFEENSTGNEVYIIESGKVELSQRISGRKTTVAVLGRGEFFGELVMFTDTPRSVTAVAVGKTTLVSLFIEELLHLTQTNFQFALTLMQALMNRLRDSNSTLRALIARVYEFSDGVVGDLFSGKQHMKLGAILIEMGCLTKLQLERYLEKQREIHLLGRGHKLLGEIMVESGNINDEQLRSALAEQRIRLRRPDDT